MSQELPRNNFFDPILSILGVITSLTASLTPLFSSLYINDLFIKGELAKVSSIIAFIFSVIFIWSGMSNYQPSSLFGLIKKIIFTIKEKFFHKKTEENKRPFLNITQKSKIIFEYIFLSILFFVIFLWLAEVGFSSNSFASVIQSLSYILFFIFLSYTLGNLFGDAKQKFDFEQKTKLYPRQIENLLSDYGYTNPSIKIKENVPLTNEDAEKAGVQNLAYKKLTVETNEGKVINFIVDYNATQLIKEI